MLNTIPLDYLYWLEKRPSNDDLVGYDWFQSLELLQGFCILNYFMLEPDAVDVYLKRLKLSK